MIIFLRKKHLFLFSGIFFLLLLSIKLISASQPEVPASNLSKNTKTIVLDAGHGIPDGGAVGNTGANEAEINLDVTLKLKQHLKKSGIKVILTRSDENAIFDNNLKTIKQKKVSDLHNREKIINSSDADFFVSIHMNKFTDSKYSGPQVFYSPSFNQSETLAKNIQNSLISELNPEMKREIKKSDGSIYLLKSAKIPGVLVECGFLSNDKEEKLLLSSAYREKVAFAIYKGIMNSLT